MEAQKVQRLRGKPPISDGSQGSQTGQVQFSEMFRQEMERATENQKGIAFSKHAMIRAEERGIEVTPDLMNQLADSVEKAQSKGVTNIVAFDANQAFIINVPNGRVITTMSQSEMKDNIFTNIDGAVIL
ncbi:MAG: flagellar biosynthesis protein [Firmicutes bacterium]|nr:flagellar biosynthesis protein [Bacillota bacterium]